MRTAFLIAILCALAGLQIGARAYDLEQLPNTADGFKISFYAREPELVHPVSMCFDAKGRMFVGGGPQFRWPKKDTPKDDVRIIIDKDGDGKADEFKIFAEGFNCIQALAWKGNDLWVCHCPNVTIIRDLDGDDVADEFVDVFTDLGPLRHGLHGFNWGPDGKLYMSQGNNTCTPKAPKAFRDLMNVKSDAPDEQTMRTYKKGEWKAEFLEPYNTESEGGILRCDADGKNLEIFARGARNNWDMAFDGGFNWICGDNDDGPEHDRVFAPFYGAHLGKYHPWSYSWTGEDNPASVPISALFDDANGSAVGVVHYRSEHFPEKYRNTFLMGDWTGQYIFVWTPGWNGALRTLTLDVLADTKNGNKALFRPTDIEVGPDGALYVCGWGSMYGSKHAPYQKGDDLAKQNEGRIFRLVYERAPLIPKEKWFPAKRSKPYAEWTFAELLEDLGHQLPVWSVNAQDEIIRRGNDPKTSKETSAALYQALYSEKLSEAQETWALWACGRINSDELGQPMLGSVFPKRNSLQAVPINPINNKECSLNIKVQYLRMLGFRKKHSAIAALGFESPEPRVRFEAAQALHVMRATDQAEALMNAAAKETDRIAYYAMWRAMQDCMKPDDLRAALKHKDAGVRRAALLALAEGKSISGTEVLGMADESDKATREVALQWLSKQGRDLPPDAILPLLKNADPAVRKTGFTCIGQTKLQDEHKKVLGEAYATATVEERPLIIKALAGDTAYLDLVWKELDAKDYKLSQAARDGLNKYDKRLVEFAFAKLSGASAKQRDAAVTALAGIKNLTFEIKDDGVEALGEALESGNGSVRRDVLKLLLAASNLPQSPAAKQALEFAKQKTSDPDREVRKQAVELGKKLGAKLTEAAPTDLTTMESVRKLLPTGDGRYDVIMAQRERGKAIFFRENAPGCTNCHQLEGKGTPLGPDLSDIGLRVDPKGIAESILEPNRFIIEGFQQVMIKTKDGKVFSGIVRDETDEGLTMAENGKTTKLQKADIALRKGLNLSFMPDNFGELLKPSEVADLVAWLHTLRAEKNKKLAPPNAPKVPKDSD